MAYITKYLPRLDMLADTSNPSIQEAKAGGSQICSQPEQSSKTLQKERQIDRGIKTVSFDMYNKTLSKVKSFSQLYAEAETLRSRLSTLMKRNTEDGGHSQPSHKLQDPGCWTFPPQIFY